MAIPLHTLCKAHLDQLAGLDEPSDSGGCEEIERRAQRLLNEWQKFYFSGMPFDSLGIGQAPVERTF